MYNEFFYNANMLNQNLNADVGPNNTGNDVLDKIINLGIPLILFVFIGLSSFHYISKSTITWMIWNVFIMLIVSYLIIIYILESANIDVTNYLNTIATWLGISKQSQQWMIMMIMIVLAFIYTKTFSHAVKITKLKQQNDVLARELSILKGRFEATVNEGPRTSHATPITLDYTREIEKKSNKDESLDEIDLNSESTQVDGENEKL